MNKQPRNPWPLPEPVTAFYPESTLRALGATKAPSNNIASALRSGEWVENQPIPKPFVTQVVSQTRNAFVATPGELEKLAENQAKFDEVNLRYQSWTPREVEKRFLKDRSVIGDASESVRLNQIENLQLEAVARREAIKKEMRVFSEAAHDICRAICDRVQAVLADWANAREKQERAEADKFGVVFQPSTVLVTAWQASWRIAEELPDKCLCFAPKQIAAQLPFELSPSK